MSETPIIYRECLLKHFPTTVKTEYNPVDFIIGFASENYNSSGGGTGYFQPTWNLDTFSPEKVKGLKEIYGARVRWVISIGGVGTDYPFNPIDKFAWVVAAVNSIKEIIQIYDDDNHKNLIDGIEIHYEAIKGSDVDFSSCIGHVIILLKEDPDLSIKVVSIAPTEDTQSYYQTLYHGNPKSIDFVDYLFTNHTFSSDEDVVKLYKKTSC
ncbi:chitinase 2-like [Vicia villosa]|uniref:chitinase 2-like n=1 Tax=Vicia villosa TaxID=3911 RepID=UPI00273AAEDA|nr:chitinase 2-like [Vicia villosa]